MEHHRTRPTKKLYSVRSCAHEMYIAQSRTWALLLPASRCGIRRIKNRSVQSYNLILVQRMERSVWWLSWAHFALHRSADLHLRVQFWGTEQTWHWHDGTRPAGTRVRPCCVRWLDWLPQCGLRPSRCWQSVNGSSKRSAAELLVDSPGCASTIMVASSTVLYSRTRKNVHRVLQIDTVVLTTVLLYYRADRRMSIQCSCMVVSI